MVYPSCLPDAGNIKITVLLWIWGLVFQRDFLPSRGCCWVSFCAVSFLRKSIHVTRQMVTNAMDALKKEGVECMVSPYGELTTP